jgi:hypothetical protein
VNVGICTFGKQHCVNGTLTCDGTGKKPEVCNGLDDDCDGVIDGPAAAAWCASIDAGSACSQSACAP